MCISYAVVAEECKYLLRSLSTCIRTRTRLNARPIIEGVTYLATLSSAWKHYSARGSLVVTEENTV